MYLVDVVFTRSVTQRPHQQSIDIPQAVLTKLLGDQSSAASLSVSRRTLIASFLSSSRGECRQGCHPIRSRSIRGTSRRNWCRASA